MFAATLLALQVPAGGATPDAAVPDLELPANQAPAGAIEGVVRTREGTDLRPLPFAIIQATMPGRQLTILADSLGRYRIGASDRAGVV